MTYEQRRPRGCSGDEAATRAGEHARPGYAWSSHAPVVAPSTIEQQRRPDEPALLACGNDSGTNLLDAADGASKRVAPRRRVLDVDRRTPYAAAVASPGERVLSRPRVSTLLGLAEAEAERATAVASQKCCK